MVMMQEKVAEFLDEAGYSTLEETKKWFKLKIEAAK